MAGRRRRAGSAELPRRRGGSRRPGKIRSSPPSSRHRRRPATSRPSMRPRRKIACGRSNPCPTFPTGCRFWRRSKNMPPPIKSRHCLDRRRARSRPCTEFAGKLAALSNDLTLVTDKTRRPRLAGAQNQTGHLDVRVLRARLAGPEQGVVRALDRKGLRSAKRPSISPEQARRKPNSRCRSNCATRSPVSKSRENVRRRRFSFSTSARAAAAPASSAAKRWMSRSRCSRRPII